LIAVFTLSEVASIVGSIQHLVVGHHHHQHMLFADVIMDFDHADHGHDGAHHDNDVGHHHRGDLGSANAVLVSPDLAFIRNWLPAQPPPSGRLIIAVRHSLPERPPKPLLADA
jgi:hypothetical protein